jgi:hypothetical protein
MRTILGSVAVLLPTTSLAFDAPRSSTSRHVVWDVVERSVDDAPLPGVTYYLYRRSEPNAPWARLTPVPILTNCYVDRGLDPEVEYYYAVAAVAHNGIEGKLSRVARGH